MRKFAVSSLSAALLAAACFAPAAYAGTTRVKGGNAAQDKPAQATASASSLQALNLANQLAAWGDANKDPIALATAAKIKMSIGTRDVSLSKQADKGAPADKAAPAEKPAKKSDPRSADSLLQRARTLAGDRADIVALVDGVAAGTRGRVGGPARHQDTVRAGVTDVFTMTFRGGEEANVGISGDGDTDLDLYIYDENDNRICGSDSYGDDEICTFRPAWTGQFKVKIKNRGSVYNRYVLLTD